MKPETTTKIQTSTKPHTTSKPHITTKLQKTIKLETTAEPHATTDLQPNMIETTSDVESTNVIFTSKNHGNVDLVKKHVQFFLIFISVFGTFVLFLTYKTIILLRQKLTNHLQDCAVISK